MRLARVRRVALGIALGLSGCATTTIHDSWEADEAAGVATRQPELQTKARKRLRGTISIDAETRSTTRREIQSKESLELSLLRFTGRRRAVARRHPESKVWPDEMRQLWADFLGRLNRGLGPQSKEQVSRRALIQARVASEAELEMTVRRYGPAPDGFDERLRTIHTAIAWHMRDLALRERGVESTSPLSGLTLAWPVSPVILTSPFGRRVDPIHEDLRFHNGIDLGGQTGELVFAASRGVIIHAGWSGGYGKMVVVQHPMGYQTVYAHLSGILVPEGVLVDEGSPLGLIGQSGRATGPHLHFEVRVDGAPVDPLDLVGRTIELPKVAQLGNRDGR